MSVTYRLVNEHTDLLSGRDACPIDEGQPWIRYAYHVAKATLLSGYVNVLLVLVPLGIVAGAMSWSPAVVFILNFLSIIPLAALLSYATEELSANVGQATGGLVNATFGNAVELIVSLGIAPR
jgi:Ca2+:H+ antiporter